MFDRHPEATQFTINELRRAGHIVEAADLPGLYFVDGRELTIRQLVDLTNRYDPGRLGLGGAMNW